MSYVHGAPKRSLDALRIQKQVAAAAVEKAEAELAELMEAEREIVRLQRRKIEAARQLQEAKNRVELAARKLAEPPNVFGGRDGLKRAAEESARHDRRRRELTGQKVA